MVPPRTLLVASLAAALAACDTPAGPNTGTACEPDAATGRLLALNVGDVATGSGPADLACIRIESSASPSRYLIIPANVTDREDVIIAASFEASETEPVTTEALLASLGARAGPGRDLPLRDMRIDDRIRAFEQTPEFRRGLADRRQRGALRGANAALAVAPPTVGSTKTIRVPNFDDNTGDNPCDNPISITATVKAVGKNSVILVDDASPTGGLSDSDYGQIAAEFDTLIFPVDTTYFGVPTDLDVDERIYILYTPEVNKLSEPNSGSYVGGFFFSGDLFAASRCAQSNETEIFYLLTADPGPTPLFGNEFEREFIRVSTRGTIAHEFQHMINIGMKIADPDVEYDDETAWLNEGLSHFAEELVGREVLGKGVLEELTWAEVTANRETYVAFFFQNFARFEDYILNPAGSSPTSEKAAESLSYRGAAWAFVRHLSDHRAGGNVAQFTRSLVLNVDTGIANVESRTGVPFEDQIRAWMIANAADDRGIPNLDPVNEYASWRMIEAMACFATPVANFPACNGSYQLKVTPLSAVPATGSRLSIRSGSGAYFVGSYLDATPTITAQLLGTTGRQLPAAGARVFVLRMN